MRRPITALLTTVLVLAASVGAYAALGEISRPTPQRAAIEPAPVRIEGKVGGVVPGVKSTIPLQVRNRTDGPVRIRWIRAIVDPSDQDCASTYLEPVRIRPRLRLKAQDRARLEMPISLSASAPDSCQDAVFPLRYRARVNVLEAGE